MTSRFGYGYSPCMSDERPSRAYVAGVYTKRILRWQRTSYPYLTIDAFSRLADFRLNPVAWRLSERNLVDIKKAQVIFCRGEELENLFQLNSDLSAKVIICGNSDFEFHKIPTVIPNSVRALFLQNSFISDNRTIFTIPIGLENLRWGVNGHPNLLKRIDRDAVKDEILFGPFGKTHPIRRAVFEEFSHNHGPWEVLPPTRISAPEYAHIALNFRYVAAVRGNGVDTHRLWESLYRGIYPIVQRDSWSESFHYLGLPIQEVSMWNSSELLKASKSLPRNDFDPRRHSALWMPFWEEKIKSFLD